MKSMCGAIDFSIQLRIETHQGQRDEFELLLDLRKFFGAFRSCIKPLG